MSSRPLSGLRVVDFSWVGAGSYTTRILADLGADVIKIESGKRLDQIRMSAPFKDRIAGVNRSGYFADRNAGKKSVTIDLKSERGRLLTLDLIASANIVANNFSPGTMDRLGLGYAAARTRRADIIYVEMSMHGATGPHSSHIGYGMTIGSVAGLQHLVGEQGRAPTGTGTNYPDHVPSPGHAAFAILAAVLHWRRTGEGQYIELSQTEATVAVLGQYLMAESVGLHQESQENEQPDTIVHDVFRTRGDDRYIAISVDDDGEWRQLLDALHLPATIDAHAAVSGGSGRTDVQLRIEERTMQWDAYRLMDELQARGIRAGVVQNAQDVIDHDPQLRYRGHWSRLPHPEIDECLYNVLPIRFSGIDIRPVVGAPCLGEHTVEVLHAAGLSLSEIDKLVDEEVLQ